MLQRNTEKKAQCQTYKQYIIIVIIGITNGIWDNKILFIQYQSMLMAH